jgi:hypothetical protein
MIDEKHIYNVILTEINLKGELLKLEVPVFSFDYVPPYYCAMYVRVAAEHLFGKRFSQVPAWDRIYNDKLVERVEDMTLNEMAAQGILQPGMIVGVTNPSSPNINRKDQRGEIVMYTHNSIYLGQSPENRSLFAEQFGDLTQVFDEGNFCERNLTPVHVFDPV